MENMWTQDIYEWTTAVTNLIWGAVIIVLMIVLQRKAAKQELKVKLWQSVLFTVLLVNILAFFVHGMDSSQDTEHMIWAVMNFLLGLMITLMMSAAIYDFSGQITMKRFLPYLLACAIVFFSITQIYRDTFLIFILYETVFLLLTLGIYIRLTFKPMKGAVLVSLGIFLLIVASAIQALGPFQATFIFPFNQDGYFHLVAIPATILLIIGIMQSIEDNTPTGN